MRRTPLPALRRYDLPAGLASEVRLITTVTPIGVGRLKAKVDEILACERIVSTSLHGLVIAEAYGIPCLYFAAARDKAGLAAFELDPQAPTNPRIADLYGGVGARRRQAYFQPRRTATDWGGRHRRHRQRLEPPRFRRRPPDRCLSVRRGAAGRDRRCKRVEPPGGSRPCLAA